MVIPCLLARAIGVYNDGPHALPDGLQMVLVQGEGGTHAGREVFHDISIHVLDLAHQTGPGDRITPRHCCHHLANLEGSRENFTLTDRHVGENAALQGGA